jgi:hypothetical protein
MMPLVIDQPLPHTLVLGNRPKHSFKEYTECQGMSGRFEFG